MPDEEKYLAAFNQVLVYEVKGKIDFPMLANYCLNNLV